VTWLLDTNVISEPTKRTPSPEVMGWVNAQPIQSLYTTWLALAEIRDGIERTTNPARQTELAHWLDFRVRPLFGTRVIETDAAFWAAMLRILQRAKSQHRTVPVTDLLFATAADRHDLIVVTRNTRHFAGTGVRVLNPWNSAPIVETV
jgi:predicted nucleic acid-binding protein